MNFARSISTPAQRPQRSLPGRNAIVGRRVPKTGQQHNPLHDADNQAADNRFNLKTAFEPPGYSLTCTRCQAPTGGIRLKA